MKKNLIFTSFSGFLAVGFGAFAAHVLGESINMKVFETANRFHFYHTLASMACIACYSQNRGKFFLMASNLFLLGILFFSGSLYTLAITGVKSIGMITPIGGVLFLFGWAMLGFKTIKLIR
jgi:uncharacterized membrane protein YgdD (TMEM256/DUF423 family)